MAAHLWAAFFYNLIFDHMLHINKVHHTAIICSDYPASKRFYTEILGFKVLNEIYREDRQSYKLDLSLNGCYTIELFSFPDPPKRVSRPEATGLRHIAFEVNDLDGSVALLQGKKINFEPIRLDPYTGKHFTFIMDPDGLPIELYEK